MTLDDDKEMRHAQIHSRPDVLVVGGGSAGIAAACAAARDGADTLLVERYGFLGGTLSAVTLGGFCGGFGLKDEQLRPLVGGLYQQIVDRLQAVGGVLPVRRSGKAHGVPYDPNLLKLVADDCLRDHGVKTLFHSYVVDASVTDRRIDAVVIENKGGRHIVKPGAVIDCSGDGDVSAIAGIPYEIGEDGKTQYGSCMFRVVNVDTDTYWNFDRAEITRLLEEAIADGIDLPRTAVALYPNPVKNVVHFNATKVARPDGSPFNLVDPDDLTAAEQEGRRQAYLYLKVARERLPGFKEAQIVDIGPHIGIRETRRIQGEFVLTADDIRNGAKPADGIACSAWPFERHGEGRNTHWEHLPDGEYYKIPYRCLTVTDVDNLLVAGRCLSATHLAQASARVSATCFAMGEAAGMAAVLAMHGDRPVREIPVGALLKGLSDRGAILDP